MTISLMGSTHPCTLQNAAVTYARVWFGDESFRIKKKRGKVPILVMFFAPLKKKLTRGGKKKINQTRNTDLRSHRTDQTSVGTPVGAGRGKSASLS